MILRVGAANVQTHLREAYVATGTMVHTGSISNKHFHMICNIKANKVGIQIIRKLKTWTPKKALLLEDPSNNK